MKKCEFLSVLRNRLAGLPEEDIERSIDYYSEMIDDRIEEGLSEEEAVEAIGPMDEIVSQILMATPLPRLVRAKVRPNHVWRVWEIVLLILGAPLWMPLLAAVVLVVLAAYMVLWSMILVLYSLDLSLAACAVSAVLVGALSFVPVGQLAQAGVFCGGGLVCAGMAILLFFGFNQITKGVLFLSKKILLGIKACFIRRGDTQ